MENSSNNSLHVPNELSNNVFDLWNSNFTPYEGKTQPPEHNSELKSLEMERRSRRSIGLSNNNTDLDDDYPRRSTHVSNNNDSNLLNDLNALPELENIPDISARPHVSFFNNNNNNILSEPWTDYRQRGALANALGLMALEAILFSPGVDRSNHLGDALSDEDAQRLANQLQQSYEAKPRAAADYVIETLNSYLLQESIDNDICVICQEDMEKGQIVGEMPCSVKPHIFHKDCLVSALKTNNKCPICRYEILSADEDYNTNVLSKKL